jgi:hypothetical protein
MSNHDHDDADEPVLQEEYHCTDQELERAGFTIRDLEEMAQTDPDSITDPLERLEYLERRHGAAGVPENERFGVLLELVALYGLDPRRTAAWLPCRAL